VPGAHEETQDEHGSMLPLTLAFAALVIALLLVCANATSLYLAQKRLDSLADAAALAGADGFSLSLEGEEVRARLDDAAVREQAEAVLLASPVEAELVDAASPDGVSARVAIAADWRPFVLGLPIPAVVSLDSVATSRTALR
jgi:uncharacterized membrane protein